MRTYNPIKNSTHNTYCLEDIYTPSNRHTVEFKCLWTSFYDNDYTVPHNITSVQTVDNGNGSRPDNGLPAYIYVLVVLLLIILCLIICVIYFYKKTSKNKKKIQGISSVILPNSDNTPNVPVGSNSPITPQTPYDDDNINRIYGNGKFPRRNPKSHKLRSNSYNSDMGAQLKNRLGNLEDIDEVDNEDDHKDIDNDNDDQSLVSKPDDNKTRIDNYDSNISQVVNTNDYNKNKDDEGLEYIDNEQDKDNDKNDDNKGLSTNGIELIAIKNNDINNNKNKNFNTLDIEENSISSKDSNNASILDELINEGPLPSGNTSHLNEGIGIETITTPGETKGKEEIKLKDDNFLDTVENSISKKQKSKTNSIQINEDSISVKTLSNDKKENIELVEFPEELNDNPFRDFMNNSDNKSNNNNNIGIDTTTTLNSKEENGLKNDNILDTVENSISVKTLSKDKRENIDLVESPQEIVVSVDNDNLLTDFLSINNNLDTIENSFSLNNEIEQNIENEFEILPSAFSPQPTNNDNLEFVFNSNNDSDFLNVFEEEEEEGRVNNNNNNDNGISTDDILKL